MHEAAKGLGGKCLSDSYVNNSTRLEWECATGHRWSAIPMSVRKGHWCPLCASKSRGEKTVLSDGLERCRSVAARRGGRVLSATYLGSQTHISVECDSGHQWQITPSNLWRGKWCPYCSGNKVMNPLSILSELASDRGGRLVTDDYLGSNVRHEWECSAGHHWRATPGSIKNGSWCPRCAGFKSKLEWFDLMAKTVTNREGKLLSAMGSFKGPRKPNVLVECSKGHRWRTCCYNLVSEGHWCKRCRLSSSVRKLTLQDMHNLGAKHGGKCLSENYVNSSTHLEWECGLGHRWKAKPSNVGSGRWCPVCKGEILSARFRRKASISFYDSIAESRGGKLLTVDEPRNSHQALLWQCARGHRWKAKANNIQNGKWCPTCSSGYGERICRAYFEDLFGRNFPSTWPEWLVIKGTRRQLDGYCAELGLSFEHQGEQHYSEMLGSHFARTPLSHRKAVDRRKIVLCRRNGVKLIQVPEIPRLTKLEDLRQFIYTECRKNGVEIPEDFFTRPINLSRAWNFNLIERLTAAATARGGKCLSDEFVGLHRKYLWECTVGHRWQAAGSSVIHRKSWCPQCHFAKLRKRSRDQAGV